MKNEYRLNHATITLIDEHMAEYVVDDEVEVSESMLEEYYAFIYKHLKVPRLILVDKKNNYSLSFGVQQRVMNKGTSGEGANATAFVLHSASQGKLIPPIQDTSQNIGLESKVQFQFFSDKYEAINWLKLYKDNYVSNTNK